jgi:hypothetical protein
MQSSAGVMLVEGSDRMPSKRPTTHQRMHDITIRTSSAANFNTAVNGASSGTLNLQSHQTVTH